jgi:hypothetical protein
LPPSGLVSDRDNIFSRRMTKIYKRFRQLFRLGLPEQETAAAMRTTRRKLAIITAGTASGPNGSLRNNHRHLTNIGDANLSPCAVNGGFEFPQGGLRSYFATFSG